MVREKLSCFDSIIFETMVKILHKWDFTRKNILSHLFRPQKNPHENIFQTFGLQNRKKTRYTVTTQYNINQKAPEA